MKEVRAYVRIHMLDKVIRGLEDAGFTDMTVDDLRAIRRGLRDQDLDYSVELADRYMNVAKLALVVRDGDVAGVTRIICDHARTGAKGDGLIYVIPVEEVIHVRTGASGELAIESPTSCRSVT
ncbi:MAG: P-II family nitrogen regulator [Candidatus Binatia bacterium]